MSRAVVIGAGIGGMCAARVLSERYGEVVVIERDTLPTEPADRACLPQGGFVHVMLGRGQALLDGWFPGLDARMEALGAPRIDWAAQSRVFHLGDWMPRFDSKLWVRTSTRSSLEFAVRAELTAVPRVRVQEQTRAVGLLLRDGGVQGVTIRPDEGGDPTELSADLVVDSAGRASRALRWLDEAGCGPVRVSNVKPRIGYSTRLYTAPAELPEWRTLYLMPQPGLPRGGLIYPIEGGRWGVNLFAYDGAELPADEDFGAFARSLAQPDLADALDGAEPLGPAKRYQATTNRRPHLEEVARWPDGFAVIGDAACGFNPVYGQGMTAAMMGAEALGKSLGPRFSAAKFQRRLAKVLDGPWQMCTIEDLRWPTTTGMDVDWKMRAAMAYTDKVHTAAQRDLTIYRVLADVIHLVRPATDLLAPGIVLRVLKAQLPVSSSGRSRDGRAASAA